LSRIQECRTEPESGAVGQTGMRMISW
jgi:hypothetical protein